MKHTGLICALLVALAWIAPAHAIGVDVEMLEDPALEARARNLMKDLRCLVCQNQSIENSNATLARDLRTIVRQRVGAGDSDAQVRAYLVERYGDWVLMRPPIKAGTLLLWFGPGLLLTAGAIAVWRAQRSQRKLGEPAPLTEAEEARLRDLDMS